MIDSIHNKIVGKIAVLAGGTSCEREISLLSGKAVYDALAASGHPVILTDAAGDFLPAIKDFGADIVFIALHGTFGEDGEVQDLLESEGILYTGPGKEASSLAFDKEAAQNLFQKRGVRVSDFAVFSSVQEASTPPFSFPLVVKPTRSGSSVGVSILKDSSGYLAALQEAFKYSDRVIIEKFIKGRELTVGFLGEEALPVVEVIAGREFYDYQAKYKDSGTRYEFPAKLSQEEHRLVVREAQKAYQALGCEVMSRVDLILSDQGEPHVLEVNTIPGLTAKSLLPKAAQAAGINFESLCVKIIALSMAKAKVTSDNG